MSLPQPANAVPDLDVATIMKPMATKDDASAATIDNEGNENGNDYDLNDIFNLSPVASAILSPSFQIKKTSRSFLAVLDLEPENCLGRDILLAIEDRVLLSNNDRVRIKTVLQASIDLRAVQNLSGRNVSNGALSSNGVDLAWSIRAIPIFRGDTPSSIIFEWTQAQSTAPTVETIPQTPAQDELALSASPPPNGPHGAFLPPPPNGNLASGLSVDESFRILIQSVKDYAIFLLDVGGNIATWNAGAQLNKGYSQEEIIGKHFSIFYGPKDIEDGKPQRVLENCLRDGRVEDEGWRFRKDGSRFWANVTITAIFKNGVHVGFGKVTRNMTERRAAEIRVIAAYEESAKLKSDFLANMSHEIRTPMHGMLSACSLLLDTPLTPDQRETASIIDESGQVLLRVINDILDYSKLASGSFSIHTDIVGIANIITSVVRNIQPTLQPNVRLQLSLASDLPRAVQGDPLRYRQIMQNIVGNATKFTDKGYIRVSATVQSQDDDTFVILTKVTDSGIGIPTDATSSLFVPFTQVDVTTKKKFQGTGLGLSICKSLVELMGGDIGFTPNPDGQGSIFWFTTRFLKIKSLSQLKKTEPEAAESKRLARRGTLTPPGQKLAAQFELEKAQSIPPPLERIAKKIGLSKAEVAAGSGFDLIEDDGGAISPMPGGEIELSPDPSSESQASTVSTPATTPSVDELPPPLSTSPVNDLNSPSTERLAAAEDLEAAAEEVDSNTSSPTDMTASTLSLTSPTATFAPCQSDFVIASPTRINSISDTDSLPEDPQERLQKELEQNIALLRERAVDKRILIAEDNATNQRILLRILSTFGFNKDFITVASDGAKAVEYAHERPDGFDLCFMDISMPVMDGHEATVQMRKSGIKLPIIAMTAYALQGDREQCLAFGMDDYISKPVHKRMLVEKLLAWLPK
ncbi:hypothetical protein SBRCBS47491_002710 [Sporothrix bragantina]|uniref:Uncharacterized protein n=1 Tax=Sporothrix bragantina TaxID=671064 RepID=A0ABP0B8Z5_9PEZI